MISIKTMLLRYENTVTWKTPINFNTQFYKQAVNHWKLRGILHNILWTFKYLLISCYFIFTTTKIFLYFNFLSFSKKKLTRNKKTSFSLIKLKILQRKKQKQQSYYLDWISKKLTFVLKFLATVNKKKILDNTTLLVTNFFLINQLMVTCIPIRFFTRKVLVDLNIKKLKKKGSHNYKFIKTVAKEKLKCLILSKQEVFNKQLTTLYKSNLRIKTLLIFIRKKNRKKNKRNKRFFFKIKLPKKKQSKLLNLLKKNHKNRILKKIRFKAYKKYVEVVKALNLNKITKKTIQTKRLIQSVFIKHKTFTKRSYLATWLIAPVNSINAASCIQHLLIENKYYVKKQLVENKNRNRLPLKKSKTANLEKVQLSINNKKKTLKNLSTKMRPKITRAMLFINFLNSKYYYIKTHKKLTTLKQTLSIKKKTAQKLTRNKDIITNKHLKSKTWKPVIQLKNTLKSNNKDKKAKTFTNYVKTPDIPMLANQQKIKNNAALNNKDTNKTTMQKNKNPNTSKQNFKIPNKNTTSRKFSTKMLFKNKTKRKTTPLKNKSKKTSQRKSLSGFDFLYTKNNKRLLTHLHNNSQYLKNKIIKNINKRKIVSNICISRIHWCIFKQTLRKNIRQLTGFTFNIFGQNVLKLKAAKILSTYAWQVTRSLPTQYVTNFFFQKDLTNILICTTMLRSSVLLSFYLARLFEKIPRHSWFFHIFNRILSVFKFYCKAPISLKIIIKGRVDKKLRKHSMCLLRTQVSMSTFKSSVDYSISHSFTSASVLGIKVWIVSFSKSATIKTFAQRYKTY